MKDERIAKKVLKGKVDGIRRNGRPRTAWMSAVEKITWIFLTRAKEQAQDREKLSNIAQDVVSHVRPTRLNNK